MPVIVKLSYKRGGRLVSVPDDYPSEMTLDEVSSPTELDDDTVQSTVKALLFMTGAELEDDLDVVWEAETTHIH